MESVFVYNDFRKGGPQGNGGGKDKAKDAKPPSQPAGTTTTSDQGPVQQQGGATPTAQSTSATSVVIVPGRVSVSDLDL